MRIRYKFINNLRIVQGTHDAMDKSMFYDTVYHLNHEGAAKHTETLWECCEVIDK